MDKTGKSILDNIIFSIIITAMLLSAKGSEVGIISLWMIILIISFQISMLVEVRKNEGVHK